MKKIVLYMFIFCINIFSIDITNTVKGYLNLGYSDYNYDKENKLNLSRTGIGFEVGSKFYNFIAPSDLYFEILGGSNLYSNVYIFNNDYNKVMSKIYDLNISNINNLKNSEDLKLYYIKDIDKNLVLNDNKYIKEKSVVTIDSSIFAKLSLNGYILKKENLQFTVSVKTGFLVGIKPEYLLYNKMINDILNNYYENDIDKKEEYKLKMNEMLNKEYKKYKTEPIFEVTAGIKYKNFIFEMYSGKIDYIGLKLGYEHEF